MKMRSQVWRFFEKVYTDGLCTGVLCKLCNMEYKFYSNTTNMKTHLLNKHPIQWELNESGNLDDSMIRFDEESQNRPAKKRKYRTKKDKNVRYSMSINKNTNLASEDFAGVPQINIQRIETSDTECEDESAITLVRQMNENGEEEWLEETFENAHVEEYDPKPTKYARVKRVKREVETPPPRRISTYAPRTPSLHYDNQLPIVINETSPKKDEYTIFGEYIGNKLRKISNPQIKSNVQQLITTIMWQAEFGMYENVESVRKVVLCTVQPELSQRQTLVEMATCDTEIQNEEIGHNVEVPNSASEVISLK